MTRGVWGEREERWLRERYAYEHAPQLVAEFEREFGKKVSKGALYTRANKLGLMKIKRDLPQKAVRRIAWRREPEMQGWMERNDRGQCETELSREFAEAFGFPLSHPQISLWRSTNGRTVKSSRARATSWSRSRKSRRLRRLRTIGGSSTTSSTRSISAPSPMAATW